MTMGGVSVPLFFVSPTQFNFQVPLFTLTDQASTTLTVTQGAAKTSFTVLLKPYAPALFTTNQAGTGQASTLIAGTASLAAPSDAFPGLASGEDRRIHLDLRNGSRRRVEPARSRRR